MTSAHFAASLNIARRPRLHDCRLRRRAGSRQRHRSHQEPLSDGGNSSTSQGRRRGQGYHDVCRNRSGETRCQRRHQAQSFDAAVLRQSAARPPVPHLAMQHPASTGRSGCLSIEDDKGQVWTVYNDFSWVAQRHRIKDRTAAFKMASMVIASIVASVSVQQRAAK